MPNRPFHDFLARPEPAFRWESRGDTRVSGGTLYELWLVSQTWQGKIWEHRLQIFWPDKPVETDICTILNTGGGGSDADRLLGAAVMGLVGHPFAILYHIPNQPLYGLVEDALIAHTWQKFLETGDPSWPLHFPMAKAVSKAMDAIQAFAISVKKPPVNRFAVTGASKRGWTAWLVGASQDKRVAAIAPMVIDTLNVAAQTPHQLEMFGGKPSEQVEDYTKSGFDKLLKTPAGQRLMALEDPYSYRDILTLPKLLILGTNDRYWAQDALNLYWDGLRGPKWVSYTPNSGHGLEDRARVLSTLAAFSRTIAARKPWPRLSWKYTPERRGARLKIDSNTPVKSARLFSCTAKTTDFRDSRWSARELDPTELRGLRIETRYALPEAAEPFAAIFAELTFETPAAPRPFTLSTQIRIIRP